jgi:hypothetical protein
MADYSIGLFVLEKCDGEKEGNCTYQSNRERDMTHHVVLSSKSLVSDSAGRSILLK